MSPDHILLVVVSTLWLVRECWFAYIENKLINKLMSRNYYDFKYTDSLGKNPKKAEVVKTEDFTVAEFGESNRIGIL